MDAAHAETPPELVFPPQVPFSWTLRSAYARRTKAEPSPARAISYRIAGSAVDASSLAAAMAFCKEHDATLEIE